MIIVSSDFLYIVVGLVALTIIQGKVVDGLSCYTGKCKSEADSQCGKKSFDASKSQVTKCDDRQNACSFDTTVLNDSGHTFAAWECSFSNEPDGCKTEKPKPTMAGQPGTNTKCFCRSDRCNSNSAKMDKSANSAPRQIRNSLGFASQIGLHLTVMVASFWLMF